MNWMQRKEPAMNQREPDADSIVTMTGGGTGEIVTRNPRTGSLSRQTRSEQAAMAAQVMLDMEERVAQLSEDVASWEREAMLARGERDQLKADLALIQARADAYQERLNRAEGQFELLAEGVLKAVQALRGDSGYEPKPEMMREIAKEMMRENFDPNEITPMKASDQLEIPGFLQRGPTVPQ